MSKRIDRLTKEQEARMGEWRDKWIEIGLRTGEADWDTFDRYMPVCYEKAGLKYPQRVVRVQSPIVGAFAAAIAEKILRDGFDTFLILIFAVGVLCFTFGMDYSSKKRKQKKEQP